ncbi:MAG: carbamoyltransferase HypF [Gammaproteobacteria bacterium]|jgi:hydrogenase maturation protein HypF
MAVNASDPGPQKQPGSPAAAARRWLVRGTVQGVGFRPFVYRLARQYGLRGWVRNRRGQVEVVAAGTAEGLQAFGRDLVAAAPAIARPEIERVESIAAPSLDDFRVSGSEATGDADIQVPPDFFVCRDCLRELNDPHDRRYRYPFINCTQCGPRYTLIRALPYDRHNTSMAAFALCPQCRREYTDVGDRRFHAEPLACAVCGPQLRFRGRHGLVADTGAALGACVKALREGQVVAVKGVGGYHLMCDAASDAAVSHLRRHKPRPHKPLALMCPETPELTAVRDIALLTDAEERLLRSPARPIVLAEKTAGSPVGERAAPGLSVVGLMLPYSPLHHLLLNDFGAVLVATSANISGEPVMTEAEAVERRLGGVAQAFLHHDRPIVRPADDPVFRTLQGRPRPLRVGRGCAPLELALPVELPHPVLAVGGHMKNALCLAWGRRAVVSPHIGDMGTPRSLEVFEQVAEDLQQLYGVRAEALVCDLHPGYATTRWAQRQPLPCVEVQHHAAHASALVGEQADAPSGDGLVFAWDGVGFGGDGSLWGGEALLGAPGYWRRVASMRPFRLPGGERAGREPWRSAVSLAWEAGCDAVARRLMEQALSKTEAVTAYPLLQQAWHRGLNVPVTTAVGRLFDAAAALTGVCLRASFEGQGPMWLEALVGELSAPLALPLETGPDGLLRSDWRPLMELMMEQARPAAERAAIFHSTLAAVVVRQALAVRETQVYDYVGLCGGVFQNRRLAEACVAGLAEHGIAARLCERLPGNDAGISFGQVVEYALGGRGA